MGLYLVYQKFNILNKRVAAGMYVHYFFMNYVGALAVQRIFKALNGAFIARNDRRIKNNCIGFFNFYPFMFAVGDAHQRCPILTLRAGADNNNFLRGIIVNVFNINKGGGFKFEIANLFGNFHVKLH